MEYSDFVARVEQLPFIEDRPTAEAALKAVLGILASKFSEDDARLLTRSLPAPLDVERLRGQQERPVPLSASESVEVVRRQFDLDGDEAHDLVFEVYRSVRETLERRTFEELHARLPQDWARLLGAA